MALSPESPKHPPDWQRRAIAAHLSDFLLMPNALPEVESGFYQNAPEEDTPLRFLYDKAGGDPRLYALYYSHYMTTERIKSTKAALEENEGNLDAHGQLELAEADLSEIETLIQQYTEPERYPFLTIDLSDERGEPYA